MLRPIALAGLLAATPVMAKPPLGEVPAIRDGLIAVAIAYEISEVCPTIRARTLTGIARLNGLRGTARQLGYSRQEIDSFINDQAEKDRLEALARQELTRLGAVRGDAASHCRVGQAEIARRSAVGSLLR